MSQVGVIEPKNLDVVILCGGLGKRLRAVLGNRPKPMAEIGGRPFLDILIDYAVNFGFKRFILCIGYMSEVIKIYYKNRKGLSAQVFFSEEKRPLGTAGAIKNAEALIRSSPFLVMNGDSICKLNLSDFLNFHRNKKALFSMALVKSKGADDCGRVNIDGLQRILSFDEKIKTKQNDLINAGIYLLENRIFSMIPSNKKFSLEYDVFPKIVKREFYGYITEEKLTDIGTPARYEEAKVILGNSMGN